MSEFFPEKFLMFGHLPKHQHLELIARLYFIEGKKPKRDPGHTGSRVGITITIIITITMIENSVLTQNPVHSPSISFFNRIQNLLITLPWSVTTTRSQQLADDHLHLIQMSPWNWKGLPPPPRWAPAATQVCVPPALGLSELCSNAFPTLPALNLSAACVYSKASHPWRQRWREAREQRRVVTSNHLGSGSPGSHVLPWQRRTFI